MTDQNESEKPAEQISEERRAFLEKARKSAFAAPAAALLLAATTAKGAPALSGAITPPR